MGRIYVCNGAQLKCSMGTSTSVLVVLPERRILLDGQPQANIMDFQPNTNIQSFGLCFSLANPAVAAATAAHLGVLTPMPCVPKTSSPWVKGEEKLLLKNFPALCQDDTLQCAWQGTISIVHCGQGMGQGAFPLSKEDADGEMPERLFINWDAKTADVDGTVCLHVRSLNKKRTSASFKLIDVDTDETLKEITVQLDDGEGYSEDIIIPEEWESRTIKAIEVWEKPCP